MNEISIESIPEFCVVCKKPISVKEWGGLGPTGYEHIDFYCSSKSHSLNFKRHKTDEWLQTHIQWNYPRALPKLTIVSIQVLLNKPRDWGDKSHRVVISMVIDGKFTNVKHINEFRSIQEVQEIYEQYKNYVILV